MRLLVEDAIWDHFPGLRIILTWVEGIDNRTDRPALGAELEACTSALGERWSHPNPQAHPHIAAWREAARRAGFSGKKFPSSIEALVRRVLAGKGVGSINPLVDLYNRVSLTHLVPAGGWDLDGLGEGDLYLAFSRGGEAFRAIGADAHLEVEPGEVSYMVGGEVVTRHFVWRQAERGKLSRDTHRALLISECLSDVDDASAGAVAEDLVAGLGRHFEVEVQSVVLSAGVDSPAVGARRGEAAGR